MKPNGRQRKLGPPPGGSQLTLALPLPAGNAWVTEVWILAWVAPPPVDLPALCGKLWVWVCLGCLHHPVTYIRAHALPWPLRDFVLLDSKQAA